MAIYQRIYWGCRAIPYLPMAKLNSSEYRGHAESCAR